MRVAGNGGYRDVMEVAWVGHGGGQSQGGVWVRAGDAVCTKHVGAGRGQACGAQGTKGQTVGGRPSTVNATRPCSRGWGSIGAASCRLGIAGLGERANGSGRWGRRAGE